MSGGRAATVLTAITAEREPIALPEVLATAGLQQRVDRKYLLTPGQLADLAAALHGDFRVLDIEGRRLHGYESAYFDTPELDCYRDHRQGRRRRYKVRTRAYTDTADQLVEVKLEGPRGHTDKRRLPRPAGASPRELDPDAWQFVAAVLDAYGVRRPPDLRRSLVTTYQRATLVDPIAGTRLTLDVDLEFSHRDVEHRGPDLVLVESKSTGVGAADRALAHLGIRPVSISKYCVGLALTRPDLPANRWSRVLRREFGWSRTPHPA